jgi:hypothetical protein
VPWIEKPCTHDDLLKALQSALLQTSDSILSIRSRRALQRL